MKIIDSYLRLANGKIQKNNIKINIEEENVTCVSINGFSDGKLDADFGAGIDIEIEDVCSVFSDYSAGIFWANPQFGEDFSAVPDVTQELVYKKKDGKFGVIIPVVSENYKCALVGKDKNSVTA